jgi:hypothetical protein
MKLNPNFNRKFSSIFKKYHKTKQRYLLVQMSLISKNPKFKALYKRKRILEKQIKIINQ